jgi:preprotein translocase subunit YajC
MIFLMIILQAGGGAQSMILMVGMMVIFFFFIILPQMRRQKKEKQFRENLKSGDKVVTISGVFVKINSLDEKTALLEVSEGVKVKIERSAIRGYAENNNA